MPWIWFFGESGECRDSGESVDSGKFGMSDISGHSCESGDFGNSC